MTIPHLSRASSLDKLHGEPSSPGASPILSHFQSRHGERLRLHNESHYPNRANPADLRVGEQDCLQKIVNALNEGGLNTKQQAQLKYDLQVVAHRALCKGIVQPSRSLVVEVAGQNFTLDAVDLIAILSRVQDGQLSIQQFSRPGDLIGSHRDSDALRAPINLDVFSLPVVLGGLQINESELKDIRDQLRLTPAPGFDSNQKQMARFVIDQLSPAAQGGLKGVPAQLIGVDEYFGVLREAAHNNQLPARLQGFRDNCMAYDELKKAIYSNPSIAIRILGLTPPKSVTSYSQKEYSKALIQDIFARAKVQLTTLQRFSSFLKGGAAASSKVLFDALGKQPVFWAQEMVYMPYVPDHYSAVLCPARTRVFVEQNGQQLDIHANRVSLAGEKKAIAAMQPICSKADGLENLAAFYRLMFQEPDSFVVDLRSESDLAGSSFDYCPPVGHLVSIPGDVKGGNVEVETLEETFNDTNQTNQVTIKLTVDGHSRLIQVTQWRHWPDHGVIEPAQLRQLRANLAEQSEMGASPIVHCRAGVGRTGTLLMYSKLHDQLLGTQAGAALMKANGQVSKEKLREAVMLAVAEGRLERGPLFVQTVDQFKLILKTLEQDLIKTHQSSDLRKPAPQHSESLKNSIEVQEVDELANVEASEVVQRAPSNSSSLFPQAHRVNLSGQASIVMSREPANVDERLTHWNSFLSEGKSVVEIVSNPDKLAFAKGESFSGVNLIKGAIADRLLRGEQVNLDLKDHKIVSIKAVDDTQAERDGVARKQTFRIEYQSKLEGGVLSEPRFIEFTQVYTAFDGKKLQAGQLDEIVNKLYSKNQSPTWLVSKRGVGRPSAIWVAQSIRAEVNSGNIKNLAQLKAQMDRWIEEGRRDRGPLFIHTQEQYQQLIEFGKNQLASKSVVMT